jgi:alanine racemase
MVIQKINNFSPLQALSTPDHIPQTYLQISKAAFDHNISYYKNKIGNHHKLALVIKGNGYGHGLQEMAFLAQDNPLVDWLCVAQLSEALSLLDVSKPILVFGYHDTDPACAAHKNIHFMVDSFEYTSKLNAIGQQHGCFFTVHIKIDTGLSRMGIMPEEAVHFIQKIQKLPFIHIGGIYSHFAAADNNHAFTQLQCQRYDTVIKTLKAHNLLPPFIHMSNTASIAHATYSAESNFFRVGLGAYGLGPEREYLRPLMTWKTRIVQIKTVPKDSFISYAGSYQTIRQTRIALLPIGYSDGYQFRFSNTTSVLINGLSAPVLGRVAMNITIIDITDITAQVGDEVILLGSDELITAHSLAEKTEIKNVREIITGIHTRFKRMIID